MKLHLIALPLAALALAGCSGCATRVAPSIPQVDPTQIAFTVEKAATLARASHAVSCQAIVTAHTAKILTGRNFNTAKALCVQSDDLLDAADRNLASGKRADAARDVKAALAAVDTVKTLTPK